MMFTLNCFSDQTSCHAPYDGGYCPQGLTFDERTELLRSDRKRFIELVDKSLVRHFSLIRMLVHKGTYFFDYGNSFMKAVFDAGAKEIAKNGTDTSEGFIFLLCRRYNGSNAFRFRVRTVQMGMPQRQKEDLLKTDAAAMSLIDPDRRGQDRDNYI